MNILTILAQAIDRFNDSVGRTVAWVALWMVIVQIVVVVLRYVFGVGSIFMQESIVYMHGVLFMIGAAYTLQHEGHVRIDIFYREATEKRRAIVNSLGVAFLLLPVCFIIFRYSLPYVQSSWRVLEGSKETSGIQGVFLLKSIILAFAVLVALQGLSLAIHSLFILSGRRQGSDIKNSPEL